jgi:hypothetical protein
MIVTFSAIMALCATFILVELALRARLRRRRVVPCRIGRRGGWRSGCTSLPRNDEPFFS